MEHKIIDNDYEGYGKKLHLFYINDKKDLAEFIEKFYEGHVSEVNKIPMREWFLYTVDDSGDYIFDSFMLINEIEKDLIENIIEANCLLKQIKQINQVIK